jgi:hypothetical protein
MRAFAPSNAVHGIQCTLEVALANLEVVRRQAALADKVSCNTAIWTSNTMVYCATEIDYMKKAWEWTSEAFESCKSYSSYASNTASWSSNVAVWKSNNSAQIVDLMRWASNVASFGSNVSSWASNQIAATHGGNNSGFGGTRAVSSTAERSPQLLDSSAWLFDMATYGSNLAADAFNVANWASNVMGETSTNWDYVIGTVDWASNAVDSLSQALYPSVQNASNVDAKLDWASNSLVGIEARDVQVQESLVRLLALSNDMARLSNVSAGVLSNIAQLSVDHKTVKWMSNWMSYLISMDTLSNMSQWTSNSMNSMREDTEWTSNTLGSLASLSNLDHLHYASNVSAWASNQMPQFALKVDERHWQYGLETAVWSSNVLAFVVMPKDIKPLSNAIHDLADFVLDKYPSWDFASNATFSNVTALEAMAADLAAAVAYASNNFSNYAASSVLDAIEDVHARAVAAQAQADDCLPRSHAADIAFASNLTVSLSNDIVLLNDRIKPSAWDFDGVPNAVFTPCNVEIACRSSDTPPLAVRVLHRDITNQPKHSVGIYTSESVVGKDVHVVADERMRTNVARVDASDAMAAIKSLRPVRYSYVGGEGGGGIEFVGFESASIEAVAPSATSTVSDFVPNIYSMASAVSPTTLVLETGRTAALIREDQPIRLRIVVLSGGAAGQEQKQEVMEVTVTSVLDSKRLKIDVPLSTSRCFVYGQRVSNVKTIDPIQILSLNAAATAYLDESMQTFVADTYRMKTVILDQQKQIDELQARLDRMDDVVKSILI